MTLKMSSFAGTLSWLSATSRCG